MAVTPLPAASVLLLRDQPLEVLMILRHEASSFVPSMWVFPGGALDPDDGPAGDIESLKRAARREVREETAIDLTGELVWTSRWITPSGLPKRFDTWFFLTAVDREIAVRLQESEAVDSVWISPAEALRRHVSGGFPMVFPTIKNLEAIAEFDDRDALLESRRGLTIQAVEPVLAGKKIVLP